MKRQRLTQALQLRNRRRSVARDDRSGQPYLHDAQTECVETRGRRVGPWLVGEITQRCAAEQALRPRETSDSHARPARTGLAPGFIERILQGGDVEGIAVDDEPMAAAAALQRDLAAKCRAQPGEVFLQRTACRWRRFLRPQRIDQARLADPAAGVDRQPGENDALLRPPDPERLAIVVDDVDATEEPHHDHAKTVRCRS